MRLQGVFVSDPRSAEVTDTGGTRSTIRTTTWRSSRATSESTGSVDDLADEDADRLLPDAVTVIREYDRASASLLQRRLKVGYARAARIIDQLEARGYIGAFDGSNARVVLRRDGRRAAGTTMTRTTADHARRAATGPRRRGRRSPGGVRRRRGPGAARAAARGARAQGRRPLPGRARHEDPRPLPARPRAGRLRASCRAPSTRRASCATTRSTSGWTPRTSSASGGASAATPRSPPSRSSRCRGRSRRRARA